MLLLRVVGNVAGAHAFAQQASCQGSAPKEVSAAQTPSRPFFRGNRQAGLGQRRAVNKERGARLFFGGIVPLAQLSDDVFCQAADSLYLLWFECGLGCRFFKICVVNRGATQITLFTNDIRIDLLVHMICLGVHVQVAGEVSEAGVLGCALYAVQL